MTGACLAHGPPTHTSSPSSRGPGTFIVRNPITSVAALASNGQPAADPEIFATRRELASPSLFFPFVQFIAGEAVEMGM